VEDRQLDVVRRCDLGETFLRAEDRPLRGEVAAVLARVGVADHHLHGAVSAQVPVAEQVVENAWRGVEVGDRLEQRHDVERLVGQGDGACHVVRRRRPREDQRVECALAVPSPRRDGGGHGVARTTRAEFACVQADVELREVEPEQLHRPLELCDAALGEPAPAVRHEAPADHAEVREQLVG
jgi:hypothetical protein